KLFPSTHSECLELFKKYTYIGGMPKVVANFVQTNSLLEVREIQEEIIQTYEADFPKYKKSVNADCLKKIFKSASFHLSEKVIYQKIDRESPSKEIRKVLELLIDARVLLPRYHCDASDIPLISTIDETICKLFFLDVGLVNAIHQVDYSF
ncbi:MAG: AAA family ATPase, partial [Oligoflexia bacterium]|nr:AAA family ATPase [Oligoflexia bacterium]